MRQSGLPVSLLKETSKVLCMVWAEMSCVRQCSFGSSLHLDNSGIHVYSTLEFIC